MYRIRVFNWPKNSWSMIDRKKFIMIDQNSITFDWSCESIWLDKYHVVVKIPYQISLILARIINFNRSINRSTCLNFNQVQHTVISALTRTNQWSIMIGSIKFTNFIHNTKKIFLNFLNNNINFKLISKLYSFLIIIIYSIFYIKKNHF